MAKLITLSGNMFNNYGKMRDYKTIAIVDHETGVFKGIEITEKNCSLTSLDKIRQFLISNHGSEKLVYGIYNEKELIYYALNKKTNRTSKNSFRIDQNGSFFGGEESYDGRSLVLSSCVFKTCGNVSFIKDEKLSDHILKILTSEESERFQ